MALQGTANEPNETMNLEPVGKDFVEFHERMVAAGLPAQLRECLIHGGYETMAAVAQLEDGKEIETFFRENHFLFETSPKRLKIYGIFANNPEKFRLLPGHAALLSVFIQTCKTLVKTPRVASRNIRGTNTNRKTFKRPLKKSLLHRSPFLQKGTKRKRASSPDASTSAAANSSLSSSMSPTCIPAQSTTEEETIAEVPSSSCSVTVGEVMLQDMQPPSNSDSSPFVPGSSEIESIQCYIDKVYEELCTKLSKWSAAHQNPSVKALQHEEHYKVDVTCTGSSVDRMVLLVSTTCLMCSTLVRLHLRGSTFTIANATRHLEKCVIREESQKQKQPKKTKTSNTLQSTMMLAAAESVECVVDDDTNEPH